VNLHEWLLKKGDLWTKSQKYVSEEEAKKSFYLAIESMAHLNKNSATLMKKYKAHGATDITGFGIMGHA
jgi:selenide,water dikinase